VPLRPVSELGLVDLTDLASRDAGETATRRIPTRARSTRSQSARRGPDKGGSASRSSGPSHSRGASTPGNAPTTRTPRTNGATRQKSSSGKRQGMGVGTRDGSERPISKSKHRKDGGSDGSRRTASASTQKRRKRSGGGSRPGGDGPRSASSTAGVRRGVSPDRRRRPGPRRELKSDSFKTKSALAKAHPRAAKIGISVVTGTMGVAGGLLLSRAALRR
jgi:hypothetical protein